MTITPSYIEHVELAALSAARDESDYEAELVPMPYEDRPHVTGYVPTGRAVRDVAKLIEERQGVDPDVAMQYAADVISSAVTYMLVTGSTGSTYSDRGVSVRVSRPERDQ